MQFDTGFKVEAILYIPTTLGLGLAHVFMYDTKYANMIM